MYKPEKRIENADDGVNIVVKFLGKMMMGKTFKKTERREFTIFTGEKSVFSSGSYVVFYKSDFRFRPYCVKDRMCWATSQTLRLYNVLG